MKIYSLIISAALLLSGCGGGGGGSGDNVEGSDSPPTKPDSVADASTKRMADLNVPDGFDYRTEVPVKLHLSLETRPEGGHYLSIYSRYQLVGSGPYIPDISSRMVNVPFSGQELSLNLVFPSISAPIMLELWSRDEPMPIQTLIALEPQVLTEEHIEINVAL